MNEKIKIDLINRTIEKVKLDNGLEVLIYNDDSFEDYYAKYVIKYGGVDLAINDEDNVIKPGTAHFLEHIMFNGQEYDYFDKFNELGASANAYTSMTETAYLFGTSQNFTASLKELIKMCQTLTIEQKDIIKEREIINEEIDMYAENPGFKGQYKLSELMYKNAYRNDIAGTKEDIANLDVEYFERIFEHYYSPENCQLIIAGPFNVEEIVQQIKGMQIRQENNKVQRKNNQEEIRTENKVAEGTDANVQTPYLFGASKLEFPKNKREKMISILSWDILENLKFNISSPDFLQAIKEKTINDSFYLYNYINKDINAIIYRVIGEIEYKKVNDFIKKQLIIKQQDFDAINKSLNGIIGSEIRSFSTAKKTVDNITNIQNLGLDVKSFYDLLITITAEEINNWITNKIQIVNTYNYILRKDKDSNARK